MALQMKHEMTLMSYRRERLVAQQFNISFFSRNFALKSYNTHINE